MIRSRRVYLKMAGRVEELKQRLVAVASDPVVQQDRLLAVAVPASLRTLIRALEAEMLEFQADPVRGLRRQVPEPPHPRQRQEGGVAGRPTTDYSHST